MGLVRMGPPTDLILQLKCRFGIEDFVETGTYYGETAVWAASNFTNVTTIENSECIYTQTVSKYSFISNIRFIFGNSRSILKDVVQDLVHPTIFWLDGHWSGGLTYGETDECPLIDEISIINESKYSHFLFIDDARLFASPPPRPHRIEEWPPIDNIIESLKKFNHTYYIVIIEDVIIAIPNFAKDIVASYCQEINTRTWEGVERRDGSTLRQGSELLVQGLRLVARGLYTEYRNLVLRNDKVIR